MKTTLLLAALVLGFTPSVTYGSSIGFDSIGKAEVVTVAGIRDVRAWAGELNWHWVSGKPVGWADPFYSYCVDLLHDETNPQNVSIISTDDMGLLTAGVTLSSFGAQKAAWLFNTYASTIHASGTNAMGAGLQLAIWEVLYDDGLSLTTGTNFRVTAASADALSAGGSYLTALAAAGEGYKSARATVLDAPIDGLKYGHGQDQIVNTPVPEPGTLLLMGAGLAGLVWRRRRPVSG